MNTSTLNIFSQSKNNDFNTIIGGVSQGTRIDSALKLASYLTISESDISNFTIEDENIKCNINTDYEINGRMFQNTIFTVNSPTFYYDLDGRCKKITSFAFYVSLNTIMFYFPQVSSIAELQFYHSNYDTSNGILPIRYIYMPKLTGISERTFHSRSRPTNFYCNNFLQTSNNGQPDINIADAITNRGVNTFYVDTNAQDYLLSIEELNLLHP